MRSCAPGKRRREDVEGEEVEFHYGYPICVSAASSGGVRLADPHGTHAAVASADGYKVELIGAPVTAFRRASELEVVSA